MGRVLQTFDEFLQQSGMRESALLLFRISMLLHANSCPPHAFSRSDGDGACSFRHRVLVTDIERAVRLVGEAQLVRGREWYGNGNAQHR